MLMKIKPYSISRNELLKNRGPRNPVEVILGTYNQSSKWGHLCRIHTYKMNRQLKPLSRKAVIACEI